jgi:phosphoadenosine phosphosulfate reductase
MGALDSAERILRGAAEKSPAILVAYSGGKDSIATLDLCKNLRLPNGRPCFRRIECFFMYLVPGLECVETMLDWARTVYGVTIHQYPHWILSKYVKHAIYCAPSLVHENLPEWKLRDVYTLAMADTKIPLIATGAKKADSLWRKRQMTTTQHWDVVSPLAEWTKLDVMSYLKARGLPIPESSGRSATGVDLSTPALLWLHDNFPQDFEKLCEVFPFAEAVVWRREWYGVE